MGQLVDSDFFPAALDAGKSVEARVQVVPDFLGQLAAFALLRLFFDILV